MTTFLGTIEQYPQCHGVACFGLAACSNISAIGPGKKCTDCPLCGPDGQVCPHYKCSGYRKIPLFDENGCQVCSGCDPKMGTCTDLDCVKPKSCGECTELYTPSLWHGGAGCTECRRTKHKGHLKRCKNNKRADPNCPYGTYATVLGHDCSSCCRSTSYQCQPSRACDSVICGPPKCPSGSFATEQTDDIGCKLCPTCVKCPDWGCIQPECGDCAKKVVPTFENGCKGCPECRAKSKLKTCADITCADPGCTRGFISEVGTDESGCCKGCPQCQPSSKCPSVVCKNPSCPAGSTIEQQYDSNNCKLCKICKKSKLPPSTTTSTTTPASPTDAPTTTTTTTEPQPPVCGDDPICKPCSEYYKPILPNGCSGCTACRDRRLQCRKCETIVQPDCVDCCPVCQIQEGFCVDCPSLSNCPKTPPVCGLCSALVSSTSETNCPGCLQCEIQRSRKLCPPVQCEPRSCANSIRYISNNCCLECLYDCQPDGCPDLICVRCRDGYTQDFDQVTYKGCIVSCPPCVPIDPV